MEIRESTLAALVVSKNSFWKNKKVFITGHTGFKGTWLTLMLKRLGADVCGYSLKPNTDPSFFESAGVAAGITHIIGDIRNLEFFKKSVLDFNPDVVFHLAAQPLVRKSYQDPVETFSTNIMGTVNLFQILRECPQVKCTINVTTDKCYENPESNRAFTEEDKLWGKDPYSSSKVGSELVSDCYRFSFLKDKLPMATARAGNVIGGGDWSEDRLIPDLVRALSVGEKIILRNPNSTRPWQHVIEPLNGYLMLAERLYQNFDFSGAWNFGPDLSSCVPVQQVTESVCKHWKLPGHWRIDEGQNPYEAKLLRLDISKSKKHLAWKPVWDLDKTLKLTTEWYQQFYQGNKVGILELSLGQIDQYFQDGRFGN